MRRAAYLELMEVAHTTGQLYWKVGDAYVHFPNQQARLARIQELRDELRAAFDPLMRSTRIVALEGPGHVSAAAEAVRQATQEANSALAAVWRDEPDAHRHFEDADTRFQLRLEQFTRAAQTAMSET